jgi:2-methylcitrate dehydratase PrpD
MKRRNFLEQSLVATASLALPQPLTFAQKDILSPETQALSIYMSEAANAKLPPEAIEHTKYHMIDTFAAIISGSELLPGQAAFNYLKKFGSKGTRTVIASKFKASPIDAALANGVMGHADETDDSHGRSRSHPGCAVVPAALACGEEFQISGIHLLNSIALGYDVGTRLLMSMGGPKFSYESHKSSHSIAGIFGAAAAAASTAKLNPQQMRWILDYTSQQSSGIAVWGRDTDHIEKAFVFGGMPARSGVTSALLVRAGWTGINDVFTGPSNFFQAYAPDAKRNILIDQLGEKFEIIQTDIKKWSVGSPIQGPLDALELIRKRSPFSTKDVVKVTVRLEPAVSKVVNNRDMPDVCLQHMMAIMLIDQTASFKASHDIQRMNDPEVLRQRAKVELIPDESLSQFLPVRVALVEVTLDNGTTLSERVEAVRGTPRNPMSQSEVLNKARDLIDPVLGKKQSLQLINACMSIEKMSTVKTLGALLQKNT